MTPDKVGEYIGEGIVIFAVLGAASAILFFIFKYKPIITFLKKSDKAVGWMLASLDTSNTNGASARKLSAAWVMVALATPPQLAWLIWACKNGKWDLLPTILTLDFGFIVTALGLTTVSGIIDKKNKMSADLSDKAVDNATDLANKIVDNDQPTDKK